MFFFKIMIVVLLFTETAQAQAQASERPEGLRISNSYAKGVYLIAKSLAKHKDDIGKYDLLIQDGSDVLNIYVTEAGSFAGGIQYVLTKKGDRILSSRLWK